MLKLVAILALLAAVAFGGSPTRRTSSGSSPDGVQKRSVIGGMETTIEENPHVISLRWGVRHQCGGSIVSDHWVVTAAHCVQRPNVGGYTVLAGTADRYNYDPTGSIHRVDKIISHPGYFEDDNGIRLYNDVAVLHVREAFRFGETRKPVELFESHEDTPTGSVATIAGWGFDGKGHPRFLNVVEVPIISKKQCNEAFAYANGLPDGEICAAREEGGKDACNGDSGGPLVVGTRLAGIVSWGEDCAVPGSPGVYTEIAHFRDWIDESMNVSSSSEYPNFFTFGR